MAAAETRIQSGVTNSSLSEGEGAAQDVFNEEDYDEEEG